MGSLDGCVGLVTGCGRRTGIGRSVALALAAAGADVAVVDVAAGGTRNAGEAAGADDGWDGLEHVAEEVRRLGRRSVALVADVAEPADVERLMAAAAEALGPMHVLVNNAAAPHGADRAVTWEVPVDAFDQVLRVNTRGVFLVSSAFARHLIGHDATWGRIVNVASVAGLRGLPERAAYSASKAAVIALTESMAAELRPTGITVNAVCPGGIDTPRNQAWTARAEAGGTSHGAGAPIGTPEDVARAVLFLADPASSFMTSQTVVVDGGETTAR